MATQSAELTPDSFMQSQAPEKDLTPDDFMQQQAKPALPPEAQSQIDAAIKTVPQPKPPQMQTMPLMERQPGTSYQAMAPKADARYQQQEAQKFTEEIGAAVPDAAAKPLAAVTHKAIEPFNKYVGDVGTGVGSTLEHAALGVPEAVPNMPADERAYRQQQMGGKGLETPQQAETEMAAGRKQHPVVAGVTRAAGELLGQTAADPRQWPLLFTGSAELKPLFAKLMSGGFAVQMGTDAAENSDDLINNWDKYTPDQRVEKIASTGLTSLFAAMATAHAASPHGAPGHEASKEPPVQEQPRQVAPPATGEPVAQASGAVEKPVQASENLNPDQFMQEVQSAVRPGDVEVQARPTPVVERGEGDRPQAGAGDNGVGKESSGERQTRVPAGAEAGRPVPKVTKTRLQTAKDIDRVGSGKVAATELTEGYEPKVEKGSKPRYQIAQLEDGRRVAYNPAKTNEQTVKDHAAKNELYKLTGDQPPESKRLEAKRDTLPVQVEPNGQEGSNLPGTGARRDEQLPSGVSEGQAQSGNQPERAQEVRVSDAERTDTRSAGVSKDVILARHGETKLDQQGAKDTVAGWTAEPLDERGKKSAAAMAEELKPEPVSHIVTSDLERAKQTANIVGDKLGVPVTEDARLRPQHTPETEGKQMGEAKPIHDYYVEHPDERPNGGETYNETLARQQAAISDAKAGSENGEKPVVLTHSRNIEAELGKTPEPGGVVIGDRTAKPRTPGEPLEHGFDFSPAEDRGQQARDAVQKTQGALPRGERRKIERTPDEQATQKYFAQARKELGEEATSDQVMARVGELKKTANPDQFMQSAPKPETTRIERARETDRRLNNPPEPGQVGEMRTRNIQLAPHKFQYKLGTDAEGVSTLLKGVHKYDPDLAGLISVWRDPASGITYVINGHHRLELARRTNQPTVNVRHIVAADASEARAVGARQNIAEGRGTAIDAAKFFRETKLSAEDLERHGLSMGEATVSKGLALSRLEQSLFDRVVQGDLSQGRAAAIGEATSDPAEQKAILAQVVKREARGKKVSDEKLQEFIRLAQGARQKEETTADLFGSQTVARSLLWEKTEISDHIQQQLSKDKKLFGFVAKEDRAAELERAGNKIDVEKSREISTTAAQAQEVYNKLSSRGGPIASILDDAAQRLADGDNAGTVKADAYQKVRAEVSRTLRGEEGKVPERVEAGAGRGPEAQEKPDKAVKLFSSDPDATAPTFYSKAQQVAQEKLPNAGPGDSMLATLRNAGVKADELKWLGVDDFLQGKAHVTKKELMQHIAENTLQVGEVSHGARTPEQQQAIDEAGGKRDQAERKLTDLLESAIQDDIPQEQRSQPAREMAKLIVDEISTSSRNRSAGEILYQHFDPAAIEEKMWRDQYDKHVAKWATRLRSTLTKKDLKWKQNRRGKWAWFDGDTQLSGAYPEQTDDDNAWQSVNASSLNPFDHMAGADKGKLLDLSDKINEANRKIGKAPISHVLTEELQRAGADLFNAHQDLRQARKENQTPTKYESYTLPGDKKNYTELLLTLPYEKKGLVLRDGESAVDGLNRSRAEHPAPFKSAHFDEPNILAHVRFDERTDADGKKTLLVEEVQSDWHQKGKKQGYDTRDLSQERRTYEDELRELVSKHPDDGWYDEAVKRYVDGRITDMNEWSYTATKGPMVGTRAVIQYNPEKQRYRLDTSDGQIQNAGFKTLEEAKGRAAEHGIEPPNERSQDVEDRIRELHKKLAEVAKLELNPHMRGVPDAPFKTDWHELAMKRMLRYAAEHNYDKLAWVTGQQTADRYDLSKHVDGVEWNEKTGDFYASKNNSAVITRHGIKAEDLPELIGKDVARKLIEQEPHKANGNRIVKGLDLKTGGEWAKRLYDQAIPNFVNKVAKKWGAKVGKTSLGEKRAPGAEGLPDTEKYAAVRAASGNTPAIKEFETLTEATNWVDAHNRANPEDWLDVQHPTIQKRYVVDLASQTHRRGDGYRIVDTDNPGGSVFVGGVYPTFAEAKAAADSKNGGSKNLVHSVDVTPQMQHSVVYEGQPLFQNDPYSLIRDRAPEAWAKIAHAASVVPSKDGKYSFVRANQYALQLVSRAFGKNFQGVSLPHDELGDLQKGLGKIKESLAVAGQPEAALKIEKLRKTLMGAADKEQGLTLVPDRGPDRAGHDLRVLHEELFHSQVQPAHLSGRAIPTQLIHDPGILRMTDRISQETRSNHPQQIIAEAMADLATGTPHELMPAESFETASKYYRAVAAEHGIGLLREAESLHDYIDQEAIAQGIIEPGERFNDNETRPARRALSQVLRELAAKNVGGSQGQIGASSQAAADSLASGPQQATQGRPPSGGTDALRPAGAGPRNQPDREGSSSLASTGGVGLSDEELEEWSKAKGFRVEPAGEQLGMFGESEPVQRVFRTVRGKEQSGLVYQSQLEKLNRPAESPTEPFTLTGGDAREDEQPRLFGMGDLGEIIGGKQEKTLPTKDSDKPSLFNRDDEKAGEHGFVKLDLATLPFTAAYEGVKRIGRVMDSASARVGETLTKAGLGKSRPEIRKFDPDLADQMTRLDNTYQYNREKAKQIVDNVIGGLSREQEKGFVLLADAASRDWLKENKPDEFKQWASDPKVTKALETYRPYMVQLARAAQELGTFVPDVEKEYLHRAYDFYTEGINKENVKGTQRGSFDQLVSPQIDRMMQRERDPGYYYENGTHEFGPSFAPQWMRVMTKLEEHHTALDFMSKGTKVGPVSAKARAAYQAGQKTLGFDKSADPDRLPDSVYYNGKQFFSPEMAKLIRDSQPGEASRKLAQQLGITELPKPGEVHSYGVYEPLKGKRLENSAATLAKAVLEDTGDEGLAGRAQSLLRSLSTRYLGPAEITEALTNSHPEAMPAASWWLSRKLAPATRLMRQQIVGLGFLVHYGNIMRRVAQTAPGGVANPVGWARAMKVVFSKELAKRSLAGTNDLTVDSLLKNAGMSPHGAEEMNHYVELNTNPKKWFGIQNAFREAGKEGGRVTFGSILGAPFKATAEAIRPASKFGHDKLFGPGGIDQRSRIWMADYLKAKDASLTDADIAHGVNQVLGRYNRASWTRLQHELAPFMLFPGWDFSSMSYVLQHPIRTALPAAVVVWMTNRVLHALGLNQNDDKNDPLYVHAGKWNVSSNLLREPLAAHLAGSGLRATRELLSGHGAGRAAGEAASGLGGDIAGISTNLLHPYIQEGLSQAANRDRVGLNREIVRNGDSKRKALGFHGGAAVKDRGEHALKTMVPLYGRYTRGQSNNDNSSSISPESVLSNVGVTAYKRKKLH